MTSDTERSGAGASRLDTERSGAGASAGEQDLGTYIRLDDGRFQIRFERDLNASPDRVWAALTDPAALERWFGRAEIDLREGGTITHFQGEEPFSTGEITELDAGRVLEHTSDVHGLMRWELEPDGAGTRLVFLATTEMGDEWLTRTLSGWHAILDQLAAGLAGGAGPEFDGELWSALHHRYVEVHGGREWTMEEAQAEGEAERVNRRGSS